MRRTALLLVLLASALASGAAVAAPLVVEPQGAAATLANPAGWADKQIRAVVARGAMADSVATFRPDEPITRGELADALAMLGYTSPQPLESDRPVLIRELDARLVAVLGLSSVSRSIRLAARDAELEPTPYLGTETIARLLGLRVNHPQGQEELELLPGQPATRAEAAYSIARLLELGDWQKQQIAELASWFSFPELTDWQRVVVARALRFVGHPYVWAGFSERPQQLYYGTAPGGFDCSGFVWRVYKAQPFGDAPLLTSTLKGRTTVAMSAEVPRSQRVGLAALRPADVVFFGSRGLKSKPQEIGHMGIYVGGGWFVHSSANGVTLQPLQGGYLTSFAWGRSPLVEAGLEVVEPQGLARL